MLCHEKIESLRKEAIKMYQIKITMTEGFVHSYQTDDSYHVESLKQLMMNQFLIELNDEETGEKLLINPDHVISISITEIKEFKS